MTDRKTEIFVSMSQEERDDYNAKQEFILGQWATYNADLEKRDRRVAKKRILDFILWAIAIAWCLTCWIETFRLAGIGAEYSEVVIEMAVKPFLSMIPVLFTLRRVDNIDA